MGDAVGQAVGDAVGKAVGESVGLPVGEVVGVAVGEVVGVAVGDAVGAAVGEAVGEAVGADQSGRSEPVGRTAGCCVGCCHTTIREEELKLWCERWVVVWRGGGMVDRDSISSG